MTGTSSGCRLGAQSMTTVRGGGSSIILRIALAAVSVIRSASSTTMTCQRPWTARGRPPGSGSRASCAPIDSPSGTITCTSACVPASTVRHSWQVPSPPSGHCSAAAKARAATDRPEPGGPVNSQAWVIAAGSATAARSSAIDGRLPDDAAAQTPSATWRSRVQLRGRAGLGVRVVRACDRCGRAPSCGRGGPRRRLGLRRAAAAAGRRAARRPGPGSPRRSSSGVCWASTTR